LRLKLDRLVLEMQKILANWETKKHNTSINDLSHLSKLPIFIIFSLTLS
jgi:hypothetical protein